MLVSSGCAGTVEGALVVMVKVVGPVAPAAQPAGIVVRSAVENDQASVLVPGSCTAPLGVEER